MSIASEITRLQTAKADIKTAIEDKGVTVPSAATLDDYADYVDAIQTGGGVDLSWIASSSPTWNVKNFFYALINGDFEHGEFTRTSTSQTATTLFTMTNFSESNPPRGFIFFDKNYTRGTYPQTNSEACTFMWLDKTFLNNATLELQGNYYVGVRYRATQTGTSSTNMVQEAIVYFDGTTEVFRAKFQLSGNAFQIIDAYNNNDRYVLFHRDRTYVWAAY